MKSDNSYSFHTFYGLLTQTRVNIWHSTSDCQTAFRTVLLAHQETNVLTFMALKIISVILLESKYCRDFPVSHLDEKYHTKTKISITHVIATNVFMETIKIFFFQRNYHDSKLICSKKRSWSWLLTCNHSFLILPTVIKLPGTVVI